MASIYSIKPAFQGLLRPTVNLLARNGVTPNQVTVIALISSLGFGAWLFLATSKFLPLLFIGPFLLIRMALNAIDGMLAREHGMQTKLGGVLNEVGDVIADAGLYLPLASVAGFSGVWVVSLVVLSIVSEMAGLVMLTHGASRRYDGPMGKSDRAFVVGVICLALALGAPIKEWVVYILWIVNLLLIVTTVNRVRRGLIEATEND
jgi:CDP-diacylglycerol--glycerol-3-phosphate 3-phosphatidyltransferase